MAFALAGFLWGVFGVSTPPILVLFAYYQVDKDTWRSVSSYGRISSAVLRLVLFSSDQQYSLDCITYYTCLCVGGLLGLCTGNIVSSHVRAIDFECGLLRS